ncbi:MAG: hypothetical protein AAGA55_01015 [Planctomycetota bacterium]
MGRALSGIAERGNIGERRDDTAASAQAAPDDGFVLYREVQGFWRNQLILVLMPTESLITGGILLAVGSQVPPRDQLILLWIWLVFGLVIPVLLLTCRLIIEVTPTHLRAGFSGFPKWQIPLERVEMAEAMKVEPIRDLGGWGVKHKDRFGWIKNISGDRVVKVTLVDGTKRTVGTRHPDELASTILAGAIGEPGRLIVPADPKADGSEQA